MKNLKKLLINKIIKRIFYLTKFKLLFFLWIFICISKITFSQKIVENYGLNFKLSYAIGTHLQRVGIASVFFVYNKNIQFSGRAEYHFNMKNFGPSISGDEYQLSFATLFAFGKQDSTLINYSHYLQNHTNKAYSFAFSYNYYYDLIGTSQPSGTGFLQIKNCEIITENDLFGKRAADKFRTATFKFVYRYENYSIALNSILWTGATRVNGCYRIQNTGYPSRWGYKDLSKNKYGKFSNGVLSIQFENCNNWYINQNIRIDAGIDSEHVRHFFQNKIIHDMFFYPKKWDKANNPHFPMLTESGEPFLFKDNQKVRKPKLYFVFFINSTLFY